MSKNEKAKRSVKYKIAKKNKIARTKGIEAKKGGIKKKTWGSVESKQGLYSRIAKYGVKAVEVVAEALDSEHRNVRLGAAKVILNKIVPDLKSTHVTGELGLKRIPSKEEYEAALREMGIDPRSGLPIGEAQTNKDGEGK